NTNTRIPATTPSYQDVLSFYPASGEFFTQDQVDSKALVACLGATTAQNLFGDSDPIDQTIRVNAGGASANLRIICVMQPKGGTGFLNKDDQVILPLTTGISKLQTARTAYDAETISQIDITVTSHRAIE